MNPAAGSPASTLRLSLFGLGGRSLVTALSLLNTILLARLLEPSGFGQYAVFVRAVSVLTMIGDLGLAQSAIAFFGRAAGGPSRLYGTFLRVLVASSLVTISAAAVVLWLGSGEFLPGMSRHTIWLLLALVPLSVYANFWNGMMIGSGEIRMLNTMRVVASAGLLACTLIIVAPSAGGVRVALACYAAVMGVQVIVMAFVARRSAGRTEVDARPPDPWREVVGFGARGYGNIVFSGIWTAVPLFVLNAMHGPAAAGIFAVAQQIADKLLIPVLALQEAVYRRIAVVPAKAAKAAMDRYLSLTVWAAAGVALAAFVVLGRLLPLVFGEKYAASGEVLGLLLAGVPFMAMLIVIDPYFISARRRPGLASLLAAANVLVVVVLAMLLIPAHGVHAAAIVQVLTQFAGAVLALIVYTRLSGSSLPEVLASGIGDVARLLSGTKAMLWTRKEGR